MPCRMKTMPAVIRNRLSRYGDNFAARVFDDAILSSLLFLVQPTCGIPGSLIERFFIDRRAELFAKFTLGLQSPHLLLAGPRLCIELRIVEHHGDFKVVLIEAVPAFRQMHGFAVDVAE